MLKLKLAFISAAIICALGGAFAGKAKQSCENRPQFFKYAGGYYPAGTYGEDYVCTGTGGFCTYYLTNPVDPNSWAPCRTGTFSWVGLKK
jgi:hypothetical protein